MNYIFEPVTLKHEHFLHFIKRIYTVSILSLCISEFEFQAFHNSKSKVFLQKCLDFFLPFK
jgi:hypothetical protein